MKNITKEYLEEEYINKNKSFQDIATDLGTYPKKIARLAKKFNIKSRDKADAQKLVFVKGKVEHPTKGKVRTAEEKLKISKGIVKTLEELPKDEIERRKTAAKERWKELSEVEKLNLRRSALKAIHKSSKDGSKFERFIYQSLIERGYHVEFHKEQVLMNERLQIDIYLPKLAIAIEIDGRSHYEPIWGAKNLQRNRRADQEKNGLLLSKGITVIRIKQFKNPSLKVKNDIINKLIEIFNNPNREKLINI